MCLILFAMQAHARYPLIVAANRDEAYARPTASAAFWPDHPEVYAGRDVEHGGTWLGLSLKGRFAAITNYRQGGPRSASERSRGDLTRAFLTGSDAPADYLRRVESDAAAYNGFSLLVAAAGELWFYSNRGGTPTRVTPGVHGLSNHLLDEPWPKVKRGVAELETLLDADERELSTRLMRLLGDRAPAPDHLLPSTGVDRARERALSSSFIEGDAYGTRASTVVLVGSQGDTLFIERTYEAGGRMAGETRTRFDVAQGFTRSRAAPARA
jgi:uncharacterized protein with NRDE domain